MLCRSSLRADFRPALLVATQIGAGGHPMPLNGPRWRSTPQATCVGKVLGGLAAAPPTRCREGALRTAEPQGEAQPARPALVAARAARFVNPLGVVVRAQLTQSMRRQFCTGPRGRASQGTPPKGRSAAVEAADDSPPTATRRGSNAWCTPMFVRLLCAAECSAWRANAFPDRVNARPCEGVAKRD